MKRMFTSFLLLLLLSFPSCMMSTKITSEMVEQIGEGGENFDRAMTAFLVNWPYVSGTLEGYFYSREDEVTVAMRESRLMLDEVWENGRDSEHWSKRDLGLANGYAMRLFNLAVKNFLSRVRPDLLAMIPVFLLP